MPQMNKKISEELLLFLDRDGNIAYSEKCKKCIQDCKQSFRITMVCCPKFVSKRGLRAFAEQL